MNASIRAHDAVVTNSDYRAYMQTHTDAITRYNATMARAMVSASSQPPAYDVYGGGAPILYKKNQRPLQTSDLKEAYLRANGCN